VLRKFLIVGTVLCGSMAHAQVAGWQDESYTDTLSGKPVQNIVLNPSADTDNNFSSTFLMVRCKDDHLKVIVAWDEKLTTDDTVVNYTLNYRIGDGPVQSANWGIATDNQTLIITDDDAHDFVEALENQSQFVAQVTPTGDDPITATYDTTGLADAVAPVLQACGYSS
jgi:hypothetical protein